MTSVLMIMSQYWPHINHHLIPVSKTKHTVTMHCGEWSGDWLVQLKLYDMIYDYNMKINEMK